MEKDQIIQDSIVKGWVEHMPEGTRPYLRLSRYDRPIGFWLLGLPGWIGLVFAHMSRGGPFDWTDVKFASLIAIGAVAMRGAGCTYNDIVDRDLDKQVERTALRPLAAGTINLKEAWLWLTLQCFIGFIVLMFFPRFSQIIAISSLGLVAAYPFMKRITFWPQAWLGLTFNWAVLVAYTAKMGQITSPLLALYCGLVFWTIGYDTIYACQDIEDDAMIGVKSTARRFGKHVKFGVAVSYSFTILFFTSAVLIQTGNPIFLICIIPFSCQLIWQIWSFTPKNNYKSLSIFKSNRFAAIIFIVSIILTNSTLSFL